jgi:hypothetical protein
MGKCPSVLEGRWCCSCAGIPRGPEGGRQKVEGRRGDEQPTPSINRTPTSSPSHRGTGTQDGILGAATCAPGRCCRSGGSKAAKGRTPLAALPRPQRASCPRCTRQGRHPRCARQGRHPRCTRHGCHPHRTRQGHHPRRTRQGHYPRRTRQGCNPHRTRQRRHPHCTGQG